MIAPEMLSELFFVFLIQSGFHMVFLPRIIKICNNNNKMCSIYNSMIKIHSKFSLWKIHFSSKGMTVQVNCLSEATCSSEEELRQEFKHNSRLVSSNLQPSVFHCFSLEDTCIQNFMYNLKMLYSTLQAYFEISLL